MSEYTIGYDEGCDASRAVLVIARRREDGDIEIIASTERFFGTIDRAEIVRLAAEALAGRQIDALYAHVRDGDQARWEAMLGEIRATVGT